MTDSPAILQATLNRQAGKPRILSVRVPPALHTRVRALAQQRGISLNLAMVEALEQWTKEQSS